MTILEVLISTLLICVGLRGIMEINSKSIHLLRSTHQVAASSLILQQRIEMIRDRAWPEIAHGSAMRILMGIPTNSERELADENLVEIIRVTAAATGADGQIRGDRYFEIRRQNDATTVIKPADLTADPTLLIECTLQWTDVSGPHERKLRTIVCRAGLTRTGVFGSQLGTPQTATGPGS